MQDVSSRQHEHRGRSWRRSGWGLARYAFPRAFRQQLGRDLEELCVDMRRSSYRDRRVRLWWDLLRNGLGARVDETADRLGLRSGSGAVVPPLPHDRGVSMHSVLKDLLYAGRMLRRNPGFTAVAVLSLALGIGANTAIFTVVNAALVRTLPVQDPDALVALHWVRPEDDMLDISTSGWMIRNSAGRLESSSFSNLFYERVRDTDTALDRVFAFAELYRVNVRHSGASELAGGQVVSGTYYSALGVAPYLGRLIDPADDDPTAAPVAVLTYAFWQRRFGGDRQIVSQTIHVNGEPFTIAGVSPPGFQGALQVGSSPDVTVPLAFQAGVMRGSERLARGDYWWLHVMGRVSGESTFERVQASILPLFRSASLADIDGAAVAQIPDLTVVAGRQGMTERRGLMFGPLMTLAAVVGLVLLIACANLANLLLARASARQHEIAARLSLGASRARLVRQLLTESVVLALLGAGLGLVLAIWMRGLLMGFADLVDLDLNLALDGRALAFTLAVALFTGLLFGIVPALRASRVDLTPMLKQDGGMATDRPRRGRLVSKAMVSAQVGMSLMLLIVAGLFVRTLQNLEGADSGYNPDNVLLFRVDPTLNRYEPSQTLELYSRATRELLRIPGAQSASVAAHSPLSGTVDATTIRIPERTPTEGERFGVYLNMVGEQFFDVFEIPVLLGRTLDERDLLGAPRVAVVNETFVQRYFPDENPVGQRFGFSDGENTDYEIVGVVRDVVYQDLRDRAWEVVHLSYAQHAEELREMTFAVRVAADPMALAPRAREVLRGIDPNLPLYRTRTQKAQRDSTLAQERQFARMSSLLGALALLLACIGLYGVLSYSVVRRTREIGVRMALGARDRDVAGLVVRELAPVAVGIVLGLGAAYFSTRWLESLLFGLAPMDPLSLISATVLLAGVAGFAAWLPVRRAARVDPVIALRTE